MRGYEPVRLAEARERVLAAHPGRSIRGSGHEGNEIALRRLLESINSLSVDQLDAFALKLHSSDIELLCSYVPQNYMNVSVAKSLRIIGRRITKRRFALFYESWQQNYGDRNSRYLLMEIANSEYEEELLGPCHINGGVLIDWLNAGMLEQAVLQSINAHGKGFNAGCDYFGLVRDSKLAKQCRYMLNSRQLPGITPIKR